MGSRTWVKLYCNRWISGTIRDEKPELRGLFADFLALAGERDWGTPGIISLPNDVGIADKTMAKILKYPEKQYRTLKERLVQTGRISVNGNGIIAICNWNAFQGEYERQREHRERERRSAPKSAEDSATVSATGSCDVDNRGKSIEFRGKILESRTPPTSPHESAPQGVHLELISLPKWNAEPGDGVWLHELERESETKLTVAIIRACRDFYSTPGLKGEPHKGIWKVRLRNWLKREDSQKKGGKGKGRPSRTDGQEDNPNRFVEGPRGSRVVQR